jgi:hypothetical protein
MSSALETNNAEFTAVADPRDIGTASAK